MSAAATFPWMQELPVSNHWTKTHPSIVEHLAIRCSPSGNWLIHFIAAQQAKLDFSKDPGDLEVRITMLDMQRGSRRSRRCLEYAIEEVGPTHEVQDPERRAHLKERTGFETVGKNFVSVRADRNGAWYFRLLPQNWHKAPGEVGGPIVRPPRKQRTWTASVDDSTRLAAFTRSAQAAESVTQTQSAQFSATQEPPGEQRRTGGEPTAIFCGEGDTYLPGMGNSPAAPPYPYIGGTSGEDTQALALQPIAQPRVPQMAALAGSGPAGSELRQIAQTIAGIPAAGCTGDGSCPYWVRQTTGERKLASQPQPAANAATEAAIDELEQQLAGLQRQNIGRQLGTPNRRTLLNLLETALPVLPRVLIGWMARNPRTGKWRNFGVAQTAVREDLWNWIRPRVFEAGERPVEDSSAVLRYFPPPEEPGNPWAAIRERLTGVLGAPAWNNWLSQTVFAGLEGDDVAVWVPDQITKDFLEQESSQEIAGVIEKLNLPVRRAIFRVWIE